MKNSYPTAEDWINYYSMDPHPEGGYFKEIYRAETQITSECLPNKFNKSHSLATSIYFLLKQGQVSHFHRLKSDELWYFHFGSGLTIHLFTSAGVYQEIMLGPNICNNEVFQAILPGGTIFGAEINDYFSSSEKFQDLQNEFTNPGKLDYSIVGCMVTPGFDFEDFEIVPHSELLEKYPQNREVIEKLTFTDN